MNLHVISTGRQSPAELCPRAAAIEPWVDYLHLREKQWSARETADTIETLDSLGFPKEKLVINDRVDVAAAKGVPQVQLAGHSLSVQDVKRAFPSLHVSCSVHSAEEAVAAEAEGADAVLFGHVFETDSKPGLPGRGLGALKTVTGAVSLPVIAIGGLTPENAARLKHYGASGAAVLSGVLLAENAEEAVRRYRYHLERR
ncbi:thiazole tautomerase TenI [Halobacillus litoralis]|uniref:thiazole tautomerase TenI n=1 Tax=Halobacillus litoralis TaxID=45668 RepID=UPI001370F601|nr:thiazole tautomerase TenI [Halobacillus litoralis]MYL39527.1 thiazole tautomerase TenI [Halobacillus litoralis]